jgi:hypothetical protein
MTLMESKKKHTPTYTAEFRERAVLVLATI